jgi:hypothetical protein
MATSACRAINPETATPPDRIACLTSLDPTIATLD